MKITSQSHSAETLRVYAQVRMSRDPRFGGRVFVVPFALLMINSDSVTLPDDDALLAIKGIGQWTLDYITMRGKKDPDVYLAGDLIVKKMAAQYPLKPELAAPWRSYLTLQLWELSKQ